MKRFLLFFVALYTLCFSAFSQATAYDAVATAYVTTTISQDVVFNSTMQAGGTFTFSVLAHNGGGRAGQADTANVKIQFYTSTGTLVSTVNTNYSSNLPQPTASGSVNTQGTTLSGNPEADPAVPWTNISISSTNCGGSCANVAYAVVSMYGVDGSYWAGDYGPWYRAPTLTLNGGGNLLYNPEFGPYNGVNAQGWSISPALGACQGAWGGSNACIVDNNNNPGQNTVGLVANQNGGGPSATGGTTSGQAGGYNDTMSVSNPGPGTTGTPTPTVTSTTTSTSTKTIIVGGQQQIVTTTTTTTNYSDGSHTTTTGSPTTTTVSNTAFTGVHFGASQVADTQWNVYACLYTTTCQIYSTNPGGSYNTGSWTPISSTQYITFIPNTGSDSATYPWLMILVNSDGTFTSLGSCYIAVQGVDGNGNIYLFVTNANDNGTLLSGNLGLTGQGVTFTGTQTPTMSQTNTLAGGMSANPLTAGQTGGTGGTTAPTIVSTQNTTIITTTTNGATVNTYSQPVTITTYSDGSTTTTNNGNATLISSTITGSGGGITQQQQNDINAFNANPINGAGIYIQQSGSHDVITINQVGSHNLIGGVNQQFAKVQDGTNYISIKQGNGNLGKNEIDLSVTGGSNSLYLVQASDPTSTSAGDNYQLVNVAGFSNTVTTSQTNDGGLQGHFAEIDVTGNYNTVSVTQGNNTQKQAFISANGNNNTITTSQTGTGAHYLSVSTTGDSNSATVTQSGSTANTATISLINAGAPASVNLTQTGGQSYSVTQTCYTTACGTITVRQGN